MNKRLKIPIKKRQLELKSMSRQKTTKLKKQAKV